MGATPEVAPPPPSIAVPPEGGSTYHSASEGKFSVSSNAESEESIRQSLRADEKGQISDDQGSAPPQEAIASDGEASKETPGEGEAKGPERGPDGRWLPKKLDAAAESDAEESEAPAEKAEKPLGKPRDDPRARMLEATRKEAEAKREAAKLQQERDEARAEINRLRSAPPAQPQQTQRPPVMADPGDPEPDIRNYSEGQALQFTRDQALWAARQVSRQQRQEWEQATRTQQANAQIQRVEEAAIKRLSTAAQDEAWYAKTKEIGALLTPSYRVPQGVMRTGHNVMADHILYSEQAPAILEYLADNPKEFQRIATLGTPWFITREMARLEGRLEAKDAAPAGTAPKAVSTARPPVRPVTGAPTSVASEDELSDTDFIRKNRPKFREGGRRR